MTTLGDQIRALRAGKGLTLDELAKLSNVSADIIATMEKGGRLSLTSSALLDIAKVLETDPEKLVDKNARTPYATLAQRLIAARELIGQTPAALARLAGISGPVLHELETGLVTDPPSSTLIGLAKALGITREWLQHGKGEAPAALVEKDPQKEIDTLFQALDGTNRSILLAIARTLLSHQKPAEKELHLERIKGILLAEGIVLDLS